MVRWSRAPRLRAIHIPLLVAAVALAGGGLLIGRALAPEERPPPANPFARGVTGGRITLSSGELALLPTRVPARARSLLPEPVAATPLELNGATVIVGDLPSADVLELLNQTRAEQGDGRLFRAGTMEARVYNGRLQTAPATVTTTFLVSSTAGVSAAVCLIDTTRSAAGTEDCADVLSSAIQLRSAQGAAAEPTDEQRSSLSQALTRFNAQRRRDGRVLNAATTPRRQANAAVAMARDYRATAQAVRPIEMTPLAAAYGPRLTSALESGATAYRDVAVAARRRSARDFARARRGVRAADQRVRRALEALRRLGYARG